MKALIQLVIVGLILWGVIYLDTLLYDFIIGLIPPTEWIRLIKVIVIIAMIVYTSGIAIWVTAIASMIALAILDSVMPDRPYRYNKFKASKFQERLNREAEKRRKLDS